MSVASLSYKLTADASDLGREMRFAERRVQRFQRRAESRIRKLGRAFATMGGLAATALVAMTREGINMAAEMDEVGRNLGMTTEEVSRLKFAAREADVEFGTLQSRMDRFNRQVRDAAQGGGSLADVLDAQGIALRDSNEEVRSQTDLILDLSAAVQDAESHHEQLEIATAAFGERGAEMLKVLGEGPDVLEDNMEMAEELGLVIDTETAEAAQRLQAQWRRLTDVGRAFSILLTTEVLPPLTAFVEGLANTAQGARESAGEISRLQSIVTRALQAIELMRAGFVAVGETLGFVGGIVVDFARTTVDRIRIQANTIVEIGSEMLASWWEILTELWSAWRDPTQWREGAENISRIVDRGIGNIQDSFEQGGDDLDQSQEDMLDRMSSGWEGYRDDISGIFAGAHENILSMQNALGEEIEPVDLLGDTSDNTAEDVEEIDSSLDQLESRIQSFQDQMRTPMEQFQDDMLDVGAAITEGILTIEEALEIQEFLEEQHDPFGEFAEAARLEELQEQAEQVRAEIHGIDLAQQAHMEMLEELREEGKLTYEEYRMAVEMATEEVEENIETVDHLADFAESASQRIGRSLITEITDPFRHAGDEVESFGERASRVLRDLTQQLARMALQQALTQGIGAAFGGGFAEGGQVQSFSTGGFVSGPGTSTSDSIPARLSDGEYVVRAQAVQQYGTGFLDAVNSRSLPGFAEGGQVGRRSSGAEGSGAGAPVDLTVIVVRDREEILDVMSSSDGEAIIVDAGQRNRVTFG